MTDLQSCPRQVRGTRLEIKRSGRRLLHAPSENAVLSLNESASALWELCDGNTTIEEMVAAICDASAVAPSQALKDVEATIAQLEEAGLIEAGQRGQPTG
ncbi:MAG: PqqD family protein [Acidimicrobiales bacterium]